MHKLKNKKNLILRLEEFNYFYRPKVITRLNSPINESLENQKILQHYSKENPKFSFFANSKITHRFFYGEIGYSEYKKSSEKKLCSFSNRININNMDYFFDKETDLNKFLGILEIYYF